MAWERVLITNITSGKASNGNPYVRIDGISERGRSRMWFGFGNERVIGRPEGVQLPPDAFDRVLIFSNALHVLLAAAVTTTTDTFREYVQAVHRGEDPETVRELEQELEAEAVEAVGDVSLEEDALKMAGIAMRLRDQLVGKIVLADWDPDGNRGRGAPGNHAVPFLPDTKQTTSGSIFAGRRISTHLKKAAARRSMSLQESILAAQKSVATAPPDMFTPSPEMLAGKPPKEQLEEIDEDEDLF